jgi:hypothetical protein
MRVRNLNGATQKECTGGSWLALWETFSGQTAYGCFAIGCKNRRSVGGQVQKDSTADKGWYIVPLCEECNKKTGQDLDIWDLAMLVPAHVGEAREKQRAKQPAPSRATALGSA